jgi:hypothetical protein
MTAAGESMGEGPSAPHPFAKAEFEENDEAVHEEERPKDEA